MEEEANTAPKNDGSSPTAQEEAERTELREQSTLTGEERGKGRRNMSSSESFTAEFTSSTR